MTDRDDRDPRIAEALARIDVPDYSPGFWDRLDARLSDDLVVVPMAGRPRRTIAGARRGIAILAAAAAIGLGAVAVQLATDDGDEVQTAQQPTAPAVADGGGQRLASELGAPGSTATPQDAFVSWVTAVAEGDDAGARSLLGPGTVAYLEALGSGALESSGEGWEAWADPTGRELDVIDFGEVGGEHVAGVVVRRPDAEQPLGVEYGAVAAVETEDGWLVEPAAFDPDTDTRLEMVEPVAGEQGLVPLVEGRDVRFQLTGAGVYYVGADRDPLVAFVPADADDGVLTWDADPPLAVGSHLLVVAQLSTRVRAISAVPFEVVAP